MKYISQRVRETIKYLKEHYSTQFIYFNLLVQAIQREPKKQKDSSGVAIPPII